MTQNSDISEPTTVSPTIRRIARVLSVMFSPLFVPTYCTFIAICSTPLSWLPDRIKWISIGYSLLFTGIMPLLVIATMRLCGRASDMELFHRHQRILPYAIGILCYTSVWYYFRQAHAPEWFYMFYAGAGAAIFTSMLISFKWKISAHGAAMGGMISMALRIMTGPYVVIDMASLIFPLIIIFAGAVCSSRLILAQHTPMQLLAGVANGFVCVWLCTAVSPQY